MKKGKNGDYRVGYGKPPVGTQFKPGESGNKAGRPKKKNKQMAELVSDYLDEIVRITENGRPRNITRHGNDGFTNGRKINEM